MAGRVRKCTLTYLMRCDCVVGKGRIERVGFCAVCCDVVGLGGSPWKGRIGCGVLCCVVCPNLNELGGVVISEWTG